jgi:hypothetical protein
MAQFVQIQEKDLGAGIDRLSAESSIGEGYSQKLVNWEPTPEGYLSSREGYTLSNGRLPLRVHALQNSNQTLVFSQEVSLASLANVPILIGGYNNSGVWSEVLTSSYTQDPRITLSGTTPVSFSATQTGLTSVNSSIQIWEKNDDDTLAEYVEVDALEIDESNYELTITPEENVGSIKAYAAYKERGVVGESVVIQRTSNTTFTILASEHGLNTTSLQVDIFQDTGTKRLKINADTVLIKPDQIEVSLSSEPGTDVYFLISKSVAEEAFTISSGATTTTPLFTIDTKYPIMQAWFLDSDGYREQGIIDSIQLNQETNEAQVTVQNNSPSAISLIITWEYGQVVDNVLTLSSPITNIVGTVVWGLNQNVCWEASNSQNRSGWTNYLDSYRAEAQEYLVAGSDKELYYPNPNSTTLNLAVRARKLLTGTNQKLGPRFIGVLEDAPTYSSLFYARGSGGETGWLRATTVTWQSGNTVRFTVPVDSLTGSASSFVGQFLTIQKAGYAKFNGVFEIEACSYSAGNLLIDVENSAIANSDYDGVTCLVGVFSGTVSMSNAPSVFLVGDEIDSLFTVKKVLANSLILDGFGEAVELIAGTPLIISDRQELNVVPLRDSTGSDAEAISTGIAPNIKSLLVGDSILIGSETAPYEILDLVPAATFLRTAAPSSIRVGQKVLVTGDMSQVMTVATNSASTLTFEEVSDYTGLTLWVVGQSVVLDRKYAATDLEVGGYNLALQPRWYPLPRTTKSNLPFSDASQFALSSMAADSLYLVSPEVTSPPLKWDGTLLTRSGIPRYPIQAFISKDVSSGAITITKDQTIAGTIPDMNTLNIPANLKNTIPVGTTVEISGNTGTFTVVGYETVTSPAATHIILDRIVTSAGTITPIANINYYYRIKSTDANNFSTVSAPFGSQEYKVTINQNTTICHKVLIPPSFQFAERSRYQLEVFRTLQGTQAPYYLAKTLPFTSSDKYLYFEDRLQDSLLTELDAISTTLLGAEIGTGWEEMPQGKSFTTAGNRSIVANIRSKPEVNLQFISKRPQTASASSDWNLLKFTAEGKIFEFITSAPISITAMSYSSGTWTMTSALHGMVNNQWVYIGGAGTAKNQNQLVGWYQITVIDVNTFTIYQLVETAQTTTTEQYVEVYRAGNTAHIPVFVGTDYAQVTSGFSDFESVRRLALAIRSCTSLVAEAGDTLAGGVLILRSESAFSVSMTDYSTFKTKIALTQNGTAVDLDLAATTNLSSTRTLFPSRLVASYKNRPEIFDSCFVPDDADSDSAIDVNPADGQEIVAVQPFFGETAFGQGSKEGVLIVFKTNSAYLVDLNSKDRGDNPVQKLDTQGLGCEYPRTVAPTRYGIQFANRAGVWKIAQDLRLVFVGRRLQNLWTQELFPSIDAVDIPCAHNFRQQSKYRLILNADTGVSYNHLREYLPDGYRDGSWSQLDNYPGLIFCNLQENAYMASTNGRVLLLTSGVLFDSGETIQAEAILAAKDFGDASRRKLVQNFILQVRSNSLPVNLQVNTCIDLASEFEAADSLILPAISDDALSSGSQYPILPYSFSPNSKRGTYFQVQLISNEPGTKTDILSISYKVAGLSDKGIKDAKS